jgi:hypothetical protein
MSDLEFSRHDLVSLIEKVSKLQPEFSAGELQLLLSIFELAAEHTAPADEPSQPPENVPPATAHDLKQQLLKAYTPDSSFHSATGSDAEGAATYSLHWYPGGIHRHGIHR